MGHCWSHSTSLHTSSLIDKNMDGCTRARVVVTNALSPIGLATIQSLHTNFPQYHIRAGIPSTITITSQQLEPLIACHVDPVYLNPSKRQSLIWTFVGVQSLLIIPSADDRLHTTLSYIVAAKTAGVKLITVVSTPTRNIDGILCYSSTPNVVERAVLKTKLGCCFVRLPFVIEDGKMNMGKFNSACLIDGVHHSHLASISLTDVGSACAAILANYQEHLFTRYDLFTSDKDKKKKKSPPSTVHSEKLPATPPTEIVQHHHVIGTSATQSPCISQNSDSSQPTSQTNTPSPRTRVLSSQQVGHGTLVGTETLVGAE